MLGGSFSRDGHSNGRMDGVTATRLIKKQYPELPVIGLSIEKKELQLYAMHKAGAVQVIEENMEDLPEAILRPVDKAADSEITRPST